MNTIEVENNPTLLNTLVKVLGTTPPEKIVPDVNDVFRAFDLTKDIRVVFLGQDPYPQKGVATGILFGNKAGTPEQELSPSLKIIREAVLKPHELSYKDGDKERFDITLESWARQGILMINSSLTTEVNKVGEHGPVWRDFTASLLSYLSEKDKGIIFVLFGSVAASFEAYIKKETNYIIKCRHPAYYARMGSRMTDAPFDEVNRILLSNNEEPIKWLKDE